MKFDLKTPCIDCPFIKGSRTNVSLRKGRIEGIIDDLRKDMSFICHKTIDKPQREQQHCAGALIFLEREDRPNQMMRIAERLGLYVREDLDIEIKGLIPNEERFEKMQFAKMTFSNNDNLDRNYSDFIKELLEVSTEEEIIKRKNDKNLWNEHQEGVAYWIEAFFHDNEIKYLSSVYEYQFKLIDRCSLG